MTEQLFIRLTEDAPEGAVYVAHDTLVLRQATGPQVIPGIRYMVNWKMLGALIKQAGRPVRLAKLNSGEHAYTLVS